MTEVERIMAEMDSVCEAYGRGQYTLDGEGGLLDMRRTLAVNLYWLAAHVKAVYGRGQMSYIIRKHTVANEIVRAIGEDKKLSVNKAELGAEVLESVKARRAKEVEDIAAWEMMRAVMDSTKQVLSAMLQEISYQAYEKRNTHQQNTGA